MAGNILLMEDDDSLRRGISFKLEKEGYHVLTAGSVKKGLELFEDHAVDLVICDIGLEDGSGLEVCRRLRAAGQVRFIFLTARDTEMDIVMGYEAGADDYITKPFSLSVLLAKVKAVFSRVDHQSQENFGAEKETLNSGPVTFNKREMKLTVDGNVITLTKNEMRLLLMFLEHPGQVLTKTQLLAALWDCNGQFVDDNTVAVNIRRLREKIEADPSRPELIKNIRGIGYRWDGPLR